MSEEESLLVCRAGIFYYDGEQWKQLDNGTSQIWFLRNPQTETFRIVGCREDNQQFVLNVSVTKELVFQHTEANVRFLQWKSEQGNFGLNFEDPQNATKFAEQLKKAVDAVLKQENNTRVDHNPASTGSAEVPPSKTQAPSTLTDQNSSHPERSKHNKQKSQPQQPSTLQSVLPPQSQPQLQPQAQTPLSAQQSPPPQQQQSQTRHQKQRSQPQQSHVKSTRVQVKSNAPSSEMAKQKNPPSAASKSLPPLVFVTSPPSEPTPLQPVEQPPLLNPVSVSTSTNASLTTTSTEPNNNNNRVNKESSPTVSSSQEMLPPPSIPIPPPVDVPVPSPLDPTQMPAPLVPPPNIPPPLQSNTQTHHEKHRSKEKISNKKPNISKLSTANADKDKHLSAEIRVLKRVDSLDKKKKSESKMSSSEEVGSNDSKKTKHFSKQVDGSSDSDKHDKRFSKRRSLHSEDISHKISSTPSPTAPLPKIPVSPRDSLRTKTAKEILSSEQSYVTSLQRLFDVWINPLEKKYLSEEDSRLLFSNIAIIKQFNENLLKQLQERMKSWNDETTLIGDILVQMSPYLKTYRIYCDNYDKAIQTLERLKQKKNIAAFCKQAEAACGGFTLPFFLIMPVQRIPRYMLLLKELLSRTAESHPDYQNLTKALQMIETIAEHVNKSVKEAERLRLLENLLKKNFMGLQELMEPHRHLLLECELRTNVKSRDGKHDCDYILVFNDCFAFLAEAKNTKQVELVLKFDICWIREGSGDIIEIVTPETVIQVTTNKESKKMWYEEIDKAVNDWLSRRKVLLEDDPEARKVRYEFKDGSIYDGVWRDAKMNGKGTFWSSNGSSFEGTFINGILYGIAEAKWITGEVYLGDWQNDLPHGQGKLISQKGTYDGEWVAGKKHGKGSITWQNGDKYDGTWENDLMHGYGKYTFVDGSYYDGQWNLGKRHGRGVFVFFNGARYEGDWVADKRQGFGKFVDYNGDTYEGQWLDNKRHGKGVWTSSDGKEKYDGEWKEDTRHGKGTLTNVNGYSYVGEWKENRRFGQGKEILPDGTSYEGAWGDNRYEGYGVWIGRRGERYEGTWHNHKRFGKGTFIDVDGTKYEGDWLNDRKEGQGKITYKNGSTYSGEWLMDVPNGQGQMVWTDGTKYVGEWKFGMRCDVHSFLRGSMFSYEETDFVIGWILVDRHGKGKLETPLGTYEGDWENDQVHESQE
jgi:hypothetical protein